MFNRVWKTIYINDFTYDLYLGGSCKEFRHKKGRRTVFCVKWTIKLLLPLVIPNVFEQAFVCGFLEQWGERFRKSRLSYDHNDTGGGSI